MTVPLDDSDKKLSKFMVLNIPLMYMSITFRELKNYQLFLEMII